jgi:hypothetical protein
MKKRKTKAGLPAILGDPFIVGGFVMSLFSGFLYPLYVTLILARLDARLIALGAVLSGGLPVVVGLLLESRKVHDRLFTFLAQLMVVEATVGFLAVLMARDDLADYYVASMLIVGLFGSTVTYLLQKVKETRYRRGRAAFERRASIADALGFLAGSGLSMAGIPRIEDPVTIAGLAAVQTGIVYAFLLARGRGASRRAPARRPLAATASLRRSIRPVRETARASAAEDPFPWRSAA